MNKFYPFFAGLLLVAFLPILAEASTTKRTGTNVSLAADEKVEGNFYAVGNSVSITGDVEGDVVISGGTITVSGNTGDDVLVAGGTVSISGESGGDVRVLAGEVTISGKINGSLSVVAGKVNMLSTASVVGDVMVYSSQAVVEGEIDGFLYGTTDSLKIDGKISSGVDVTSQNIVLGERAFVEGNITYVSNKDILRASASEVGGTIVKNSPTENETTTNLRPVVVSFLVLLFTTLVFYLIARSGAEKFVRQPMFEYHRTLRSVLLGFLFLFLPVAIMVLIASVLGLVVGIIVLLFYLLLLIIAIPAMSLVVAKIVMKVFEQSKLSPLHLVIAVATIIVISNLPYVGLLLLISLYIFTVGFILSLVWERIRG